MITPPSPAPDSANCQDSPRGAAAIAAAAVAGEHAAMLARHGPTYRRWAVLTAMLGTVAAVMEATIVNVALPEIILAFGIGHDQVQLLSTGFLAATTVSMLVSYWAIQRFGLRRTYVASATLLMVFSLAAAFAGQFALLALCRIVQGVVAGLLQPLAMVAIVGLYEPNQRGKAMATYGLGIVLAPAIGPVLGGLLVDQFGWRAVFVATVPFCLGALLLAPRFMIAGRRPAGCAKRPLDLSGLVLLGAALIALLGGLSALFRDAAVAAVALAAGAALVIAFLVWERQCQNPLLDFRLLRYPGFGAATLVSVAYGVGIFGSTYLVPLFAQTGAGFTASQAGAMLMPGGLALAVALLVAGRLADRTSPHRVAMAGLLCFSISTLLLGLSSASTGFWLLAVWIAVGRVGLGFVIPGLNASALRLLPMGSEAAGAATVNFVRQLGATFGVTLLALYLEGRQRLVPGTPPLAAFQEGFFLISGTYALALLPARRMNPPPSQASQT